MTITETSAPEVVEHDPFEIDADHLPVLLADVSRQAERWRYKGRAVVASEDLAGELAVWLAEHEKSRRGHYRWDGTKSDEDYFKHARSNLRRELYWVAKNLLRAEVAEARRWEGGYRRPGWEAADEGQYTPDDVEALVEAVWDDTVYEQGLPTVFEGEQTEADLARQALDREVLRGVQKSARDPRSSTDFVTRVIDVVRAWHTTKLKDEWRKAIEMERRDGKDAETIAEALGVDRSTVFRYRERAYQTIADRLNGYAF